LPEKVTIGKNGANFAGLNAINFQIAILALLGFSLRNKTPWEFMVYSQG